jgi:hypothetical protein
MTGTGVNKSQFVPVIFEPPCIIQSLTEMDHILGAVAEGHATNISFSKCTMALTIRRKRNCLKDHHP